MKSATQKREHTTLVVTSVVAVVVVVVTLAMLAPLVYKAVMNSGIQTGGIDTTSAQPATVDVNGTWSITASAEHNDTSVGYTFQEVLPGERRSTSGSTTAVTGTLVIENSTITSTSITADMTQLATDQKNRDTNVRIKLLNTDEYPTATFTLEQPIDIRSVPNDGTLAHITAEGFLTIHGTTRNVTVPLDILRSGTAIIFAGTLPFNRLDYGVVTPEFLAATVAEDGELNMRFVFTHEK